MKIPDGFRLAAEVRTALEQGQPVVALESTLIAHGLPFPVNIATAMEAEAAIRHVGAIPATIAVLDGQPTIGLSADQIQRLAQTPGVWKASRRDLGAAGAKGATAATTVAATMWLAHQVGIAVFATGGLGGVHPVFAKVVDISADLFEFTRTPVLVVCAGAKSILDLPQTLEVLDTLGVPVWGYRTTDFPAFYTRTSGLPVSAIAESVDEAARLFATHRQWTHSGAILAQPVAEEVALSREEVATALAEAERDAQGQQVQGAALTPFLLRQLAERTHGRTLHANQALIVANARLAAAVAVALRNSGR